MIGLGKNQKKEKQKCFLFKITFILSVFLWIYQYGNYGCKINRTLDRHTIEIIKEIRKNRLLSKHELSNTEYEESDNEQLQSNTKKVLYKEEGNKLEKEEERKNSTTKRGSKENNEGIKRNDLKKVNKLKSEEAQKVIPQSGKALKKEELEKDDEKNENTSKKKEVKKGEEKNENTSKKKEVKDSDEKNVYTSKEEVKNDGEECDNALEGENEIVNTSKEEGIKNDDEECDNALEGEGETVQINKDELLEHIKTLVEKKRRDRLSACDEKFDSSEDYFKLGCEDESINEEKVARTYSKLKKYTVSGWKKFKKIWKKIDVISKLTNMLDLFVEKQMFKVNAKIDEYKKNPNMNKKTLWLMRIRYRILFFLIPLIIFSVGIFVFNTQSGFISFLGGILISIGISWVMRAIKKMVKYQFHKQGIEKPDTADYIILLEKFLMKFESEEEDPGEENADGEKAGGESVGGESVGGESVCGENADGENADGENADGENADEVNADEVNADGENADEVNADGGNADGENADEVNADEVNADGENVEGE
ncbi:Plasmodium exported protein, unknown function [Plasmodium gonderi]|uniref:Uncharacterized protein n=1 Tax=Plasmodium gonderi TaxID=77519 RepID=A0A1Y1JG49_PLAGO|nr:Plasmodium exported protein, unknown function [Plasmodium gonderi]GAW79413.1 Plasmodium exported protein, unknown function [Plasmodium gonderi]